MTMNPMYGQMGLSVAQGVTGFLNAGIQSKLASALQKYRNEMLEVTAAMNENVILQNEIATRDANVALMFDIELRSARDKGTAAVSAAAAGVSGQNVDKTMRHLRGSALRAQGARKQKVASEMAQHAQERTNNRVSAILGRDITVHARPSLLAHMGNMATNLFDNYNDNQPPGDKIGDLLRRGPTATVAPTTLDWWQ